MTRDETILCGTNCQFFAGAVARSEEMRSSETGQKALQKNRRKYSGRKTQCFTMIGVYKVSVIPTPRVPVSVETLFFFLLLPFVVSRCVTTVNRHKRAIGKLREREKEKWKREASIIIEGNDKKQLIREGIFECTTNIEPLNYTFINAKTGYE